MIKCSFTLLLALCGVALTGQDYGSGLPTVGLLNRTSYAVYTTACSDLTGFTESNDTDADVVLTGGECDLHRTTSSWLMAAAYADTTLSGTASWGTIKVAAIPAGDCSMGVSLRRQPGGAHYWANFTNHWNAWGLIHHADGGHTTVTNGQLNAGGGYDCTGGTGGEACSWTDYSVGDYFGAHVFGTGTTTTARWYDFGTTDPSTLGSPEGPGNWAAYMVCECSAAEISALTFAEQDGPGNCGFEGWNASATEGSHPYIDNFRCGQTP